MRREAAAWVVRLAEPSSTSAQRRAFEIWRGEDPAHAAAFEREAAAWDQMDRLRAFRRVGTPPDPDLFAPVGAVATPPRWRRAVASTGWATAAAAVFALGGATTFGITTLASPAYATNLGERRVVVLSDGSNIELNTNSKVVVRYRQDVREVELVRGEAVFEVAADARPFVVKAKQAQLSAQKGELAVRLTGDLAAVAVKQGFVQSGRTPPLGPGSEAWFGPAGAKVQVISQQEIAREQAWRQGAIALDGQSLAEAAREFNRYNAIKIVVNDPNIAAIRVGGYFRTSDVRGFVGAVTRTFQVQAAQSDDDAVILTRSPS